MRKNKALVIVDMQNDFCDGGALGVSGGHRLATQITLYAFRKLEDYSLVVATKDWHLPDHPNGGHISDEPDYIDTWPPHCIQGTPGAEFSPNLDQSIIDSIVYKGDGIPAYSGFEAVDKDGHSLLGVLDRNDINELDVCGIATEYCVLSTVEDAVIAGYEVNLLEPLHLGIADSGSTHAILRMAGSLGVKMVNVYEDDNA